MPSRTISTKVAIEGESAYRQAMSSLNSTLKTLSTELAKVKSENRDQANSMDALKSKGEVLNSMYEAQRSKVDKLKEALANAKRAQQEHTQNVEDAKAKIAAVQDELAELGDTTEDTAEKQTALAKELDELNKQMEYEQAAADAAGKGVDSWQQQLNKAEIQLDDLDEEIAKNNKYLDEASDSADGCATSIDEYGKEVKKAKEESEEFGEKSKDAVDALSQALASAGVVAAIKEIAEALNACVEASIEYESAFAGVKKTVNATDEELATISDGIKQLSTVIPASTTELNGVAEAAGQLGIKTEDILAFTEVMTNLGVATNLSAEEAASALAKFANVVKMSPDDYDKLGSTIVALGNNFATTEADVVAMATRLASTGAVVGLSEAQIMAVATALSSLGIEAEAGGSAVSKLMKKMETAAQTYDQANLVIAQTGMSLRDLELMADADSKGFKEMAQSMGYTSTELKAFMKSAKNMEQFSEVAGMSAREFQQAWGEDAVLALDQFVTGLGELDESGTSAVTVLNDMGLTEVRLSNAVLSMAKSDGVLTEALNLSKTAWAENNALTKEAEQRYATTESKVQLAKNSFELLKVAIGDELTPALGNLAETGQDVTEWAAELIAQHPELVEFTTALLAAGAAFSGVAIIIPGVIKVWQTLSAAVAANPWVLTAAAITAVVTAIATLIITSSDADDAVRNHLELAEENKKKSEETAAAMEDEAKSTSEMVEALVNLADKENKSAIEKAAMLSLVDDLNTAMPELSLAYDEQADSLNLTAEALRSLAEAQYEQAKYQADVERYNELYAQQFEGAVLLEEANQRLTVAETAYRTALEQTDPALVECSAELTTLSAAYLDTKKEVDDLTKSQDSCKAEMEILEAAVNEYTKKTEEAAASNGGLSSSTQDLSLKVRDASIDIGKSMDDLETEYYEAYEAVKKSITDQMGLLTEYDNTSRTKISDVINSLKSQVTYMDEYSENMKKAMARTVDEGLIAKLSDGSEESSKILKGIVSASDDEIKELNAAFKKSEEGKNAFNSNIAAMQIDFHDKQNLIKQDIESLTKEMEQYDQASENARKTMQGYIDGLNSKMGELEAIKSRIAAIQSQANSATSGIDGSHASGLPYVPYDGYVAMLHKGERVLTAEEAQDYIDSSIPDMAPNVTNTSSTRSIQFGDVTVIVQGNADEGTAESIGVEFASEFERRLRYKGVV